LAPSFELPAHLGTPVRLTGYRGRIYVANAVTDLRSRMPVRTPLARPFGCTVSYEG